MKRNEIFQPWITQIKKAVDRHQRRAALYLNKKTATWSPRKLTISLMLFCMVAGSCSLFLIMKGILPANGPPEMIQVEKIKVPVKTPLRTDSVIKR